MHISRHLTRFSRACGSAFAALLLMAAPAANAGPGGPRWNGGWNRYGK